MCSAVLMRLDSGHGSQVKDRDGDEIDGYDEVILPRDFREKGIITDDVRPSSKLSGSGCADDAAAHARHHGDPAAHWLPPDSKHHPY